MPIDAMAEDLPARLESLGLALPRQDVTHDVLRGPIVETLRDTELDASGARVVEIVDRHRWNRLVLERPHYELEQGWEWGEIQRASGWMPYRYAVFEGAACVAAASVACGRLPGLPYSVLYASRGPLIDWDNDTAWGGLLLAIRRLAHRRHAILLRVSPSLPHDAIGIRDALRRHGFQELPDDWTTWNAARIAVALSLNGDEATLRRKLRKTVRQDIASAPRRGVRVRVAHDRRDLLDFYRLIVTMGREKSYPVRRLRRLDALWRAYIDAEEGVLLLAEHDGQLVGGLLGARFGRRAYFEYAAIVRDGRHLHQGPLLYWEFIRWAHAAGCEHIDWGGSGTRFPPCETDQGHGVYRFKAGFGSELRYWVPYHDLVFRPRLYRLARIVEHTVLPTAWRVRARLNH